MLIKKVIIRDQKSLAIKLCARKYYPTYQNNVQ